MRMLIVEDDTDLTEVLVAGFRDEGFAVDMVSSGVDGLHEARSGNYDIVILDLMLPGMGGFGLLEELRKTGSSVPVLLLSARSAIEERVRGLQLGADDYLCKPFSFEELLARVRVLIRRARGSVQNRILWGDLVLDPDARQVAWKGMPISVTLREFALLEALLLSRGKVLTRTRLTEHVYDATFDLDSNVIDVHIANLRRKLRSVTGASVISTVRGVGFTVPEATP